MTDGTTVAEAIAKQYRLEAQGVKHDEDTILRQKYGLTDPTLMGIEAEMIRKEAKRAGRPAKR